MLLAMDTSTRYLGVALYDGLRVLTETTWLCQNNHTVELAPAVAAAFERLESGNTALQVVAVALGPGSFTALRVGLAFARGLAFSRSLPIIGVSTLDVLAASQPVTNLNLIAMVEAGRRRLAVGRYRAEAGCWVPAGSPENLSVESFLERIQAPVTLCGELSEALRAKITSAQPDIYLASPAQSLRRPAYLAEIAWNRWQAGQIDNQATLKPLYLHHGEPIPG